MKVTGIYAWFGAEVDGIVRVRDVEEMDVVVEDCAACVLEITKIREAAKAVMSSREGGAGPVSSGSSGVFRNVW